MHPVLVGDVGAGPDADHHVVRFVISSFEKMHVVRGHQPQPELLTEVNHRTGAGVLLLHVMVVHLKEEPVFPEDVDVVANRAPGEVGLLVEDRLVHLSGQAAAQADQPVRMRSQDLLVDPGLVVKPLEVRGGDQFEQVVVARFVLGQKRQVVSGASQSIRLLFRPRPRSDVDFAADDRLNALLLRLLVELDRAEQVPVVGHGHRRHPMLHRFRHQFLDPHRPVQGRILGMHVQVDEGIGRRHGYENREMIRVPRARNARGRLARPHGR